MRDTLRPDVRCDRSQSVQRDKLATAAFEIDLGERISPLLIRRFDLFEYVVLARRSIDRTRDLWAERIVHAASICSAFKPNRAARSRSICTVCIGVFNWTSVET